MNSQQFEIKQIYEGNKGLFAKKVIIKNQQIMQCQPIAWATLQQRKTKNCNWCFLQKQQLQKCSQCKSFYYCSTQCQKKDWKYHKKECKMYSKMLTEKNLSIHKQIFTEFVLNVRLFNVLQEDKQLAAKFGRMVQLSDYQPLERRQHFQQLSLIMMENMGLEKNQVNMSKLIRQFNVVAVNAFTVQDLFYSNDGIAVGIFFPANYLNHACNANCTQIFDGRYLKIIANTEIPIGDELTINYTNPLFIQKTRCEFLKSNYFFDCFCEKCQVEKMINTEYAYIKCRDCKQAKIRKIGKDFVQHLEKQSDQVEEKEQSQKHKNKQQSEANKNGSSSKYECQNCKKQIDYETLSSLAEKMKSFSDKIQKQPQYKVKKQQLLNLKKQFDLRHPSFCRILESVYLSAVNEALSCQKQDEQKKYFSEANILLNEILKNIPAWYQIEEEDLLSMKFFSKLNEMSKLAHQLGKLTKCAQYLQKALKCIEKLNIKNKYTQIDELKARYNEIKIQLSIAKTKAMK